MKPRAFALLLAALPFVAVSGHAFGQDAQARASETQKSSRALEERIARLESQLQNQGLLNLLNQVESLKAEVARLRGIQEEQTYRLDNADKRSRDLFADLDDRVRELANRPAAAPATTDAVRLQPTQTLIATPPPVARAPINPEIESRAYASAYEFVKTAKYNDAIPAFQEFLNQYPDGALAANAAYWLAFSHSANQDFRAAITGYQRLIRDFPNSAKAPDAMLSLARAYIQNQEVDAGRATLYQLFAKYPQSKSAENGKKLLSTLN
jgi:tol-pal system protein YbgF